MEDSTDILEIDIPSYAANLADTRLKNLNKFKYNDQNRGTFGAEPYHRAYPRRLFNEETAQPRIGGNTSLVPAGLYSIPPTSDFNDVGTYTYFNKPNGIYTYPITKYNLAYSQPLNAVWDFETQTFDQSPTWVYGTGYTTGDVVYQDVKSDDVDLGDLAKAALSGNRKYYVFITKPSYIDTENGPVLSQNPIISNIPPSLDGVNWKRLRFTPQIVREPRRVVFDTFIIPDPSLNNFKTTTLSVDTPIDITQRYVDSLSIPLLPPFGSTQGNFLIQNIFSLFALQTSTSGIRVRLYRTIESMIADSNRDILELPTDSHGVLVDVQITEQNAIQLINPITTLVADSIPPGGIIYYTINNLTSTTKLSTNLFIYYFAAQIQPRVPFGYLRKHFKFTRDNGTASKRRKYLGCKFNVTRISSTGDPVYDTIDGLPPVQVFLSEGTDVVVNANQGTTEIKTGGGGTLNVT